jgi:O-antigen/teichoic acid export membrane protein
MIKNGIYNVAGAAVRLILTFLTIPLLIRFMGIEEYGLWTLISTILSVATLAEAGLSISTTVFLARDLAKNDENGMSHTLTIVATAMLIFGTLSAFVLYKASGNIVESFGNLQNYQRAEGISTLQISAFVLWIKLIQQIFVGIEQAYQKYGIMNLLNTSQVAINSLGMIVVAWKGGETLALMQWQAVSSILVLAIHGWVCKRLLGKINLRFNWDNLKGKEIVSYSFSSWGVSIGSALFQQGDRLIIGGMLGTKALGIYAAITSITGQINSFSAMPIQPLLPQLSNILTSEENQDIAQKIIRQAFIINALVALGLGGTLLTLAPLIISLIIPENADSISILLFRIATVIYSIYSMNAIGYYILLSMKSANHCLKIQLISGGVSLMLITVLSSFLGLTGAIIGNIGYIGVWFLNLAGMKKVNILKKEWQSWISQIVLWFGCLIALNFTFPYLNIQLILILTVLQSIYLILEGVNLYSTKFS